MPTVQGTVYKADGTPVNGALRMLWYHDGVLIKDFYTEENGDYCTVLAAGGYCIVIAAYAANPTSYTVTTVPLQTQDFRRTTNPPNCVRYQGFILGGDGRPLTGESQFMQWIGDGDVVVAEFWTPPDGEYAIRLPYGNYLVRINGIEVGGTAIDPCGHGSEVAPRFNFTCPGPVPDRVKPAIARRWPLPVRGETGDVCVMVECSSPAVHDVQVDGDECAARRVDGKHCACFDDKPHGKHKVKVKGAAGTPDEVDLQQDSKIIRVKCKVHRGLVKVPVAAKRKPVKKAK